jgi:hypothetical protein
VSESFAADSTFSSIQIAPNSTQPEEPAGPTAAMPFGLSAQEASNLEGALSFLFTLIASYSELVEDSGSPTEEAA